MLKCVENVAETFQFSMSCSVSILPRINNLKSFWNLKEIYVSLENSVAFEDEQSQKISSCCVCQFILVSSGVQYEEHFVQKITLFKNNQEGCFIPYQRGIPFVIVPAELVTCLSRGLEFASQITIRVISVLRKYLVLFLVSPRGIRGQRPCRLVSYSLWKKKKKETMASKNA